MPSDFRVHTDACSAPRGTPNVPAADGPATPDVGRFIPPTMLREGDCWTILYRGRLIRVRHNKGLSYLAQLVARPWESLHVSELYGKERGAEVAHARPAESDRKAVTSRIRAALSGIQQSDLGLGEHLVSTITTGTYCCYSPRPDAPVR